MAVAPIVPMTASAPPMTAGLLQISQGSSPAMIAQQTAETNPVASFQEFFADAIKQTNSLQGEAEQAQRSLLVGDSDNLHGVMIAMEKADMAFQLTMAVRNKVLDAYQAVMQMQM
jgi:flagellar hook-basal body complex protein FliE